MFAYGKTEFKVTEVKKKKKKEIEKLRTFICV